MRSCSAAETATRAAGRDYAWRPAPIVDIRNCPGPVVIEGAGARSRPFRWSVVGVDDVGDIAAAVGFGVASTHRHGEDRWSVVLEEQR